MADTNPSKSQGISTAEAKDLTVAGAKMSPEQLTNANTILGQAIDDGAPPKATKSMVCAAIGESGLKVVKNPHSKYAGVFQADPAQIPPDETATQAHYYLVGGFGFQGGGAIQLAKDNPSWTVGHIAFTVEGDLSNFGGDEAKAAAFYDDHADEADAIIEAFGGIGDFTESNSSDNVAVSYQFTRGTVDDPNENSWDAGQRLAGEVDGWDLFAVANRFYYFSEQRLIRQTPIAIFDRADRDVVVSLRGTVDNTGNATECRITVICGPLDFHAGEVVKIINAGPFSTGRYKGRWIVSDTSRSVFEISTELTLKLPAAKGIEPAHETKPGSATKNTSTSGSGLYVNPFRGATVTVSRIDQGVDYVISGPIGAIGDGKVVALLNYQGFGTYLVYQLTAGEFATNYVYVSEGITPAAKVGATVKAGDKIATGTGAIEIGWAQPGPTYLPMAKITGGYTEGQKTAAGAHFNDLLVSLGVASGTTSGRPTVGHFP